MCKRILFWFYLITCVHATYKCVCSFDGARPVFRQPDTTSDVIGFLATNGCRQYVYPVDETWNAIVFMHQLGFIISNTSMIQTCFSDPIDSFSTARATLTTTSATFPITTSTTTTTTRPTATTTTIHTTTTITTTTTTTTTRPTTTTTTRPSTTTSMSTSPTTTPLSSLSHANLATSQTSLTSPSVPEGHTELCPDYLKGDLNIFGGFLGQYGDYCYEFVNVSTQWHNVQRHCTVAGNGYLVHVHNKAEQDYLVRFLGLHHRVESVWIGLTDDTKEGATAEGQWKWISGDHVTYTNFGPEYYGHSNYTHGLNDCVIMKQGGEWTDVPCGVALIIGTGFGESHAFICQYNVTSKPPNIYHIVTDVLVG